MFDISGFIFNYDLDKKIATLAAKAELNSNQDKITNYKCLIQVIFVRKVFLEMMEHIII